MAAKITVNGTAQSTALQSILQSDDIQPGSDPSYQMCKTLYLYHPLGAKMAESPVKMAQSQKRNIEVPDSPGTRVKDKFEAEWEKLGIDKVIFALARTARIYGVASVAILAEGVPLNEPLDYTKLPAMKIAFNVYDPLNTAGSLVLDQNPDSLEFQKVKGISIAGKVVHPSRSWVMMNEEPIYIAYTTSAFGYVGRSVYQRVLYLLKSFVQTMITDDLVTVKVGVLIAKLQQAGSIIDNMMQKAFGLKREIVKEASTGNVISVGLDENVESLNFRNMEGPYQTSRENILKNIATGADMPAKLLENETFVEGFGEGTEDAKNIAKYIDSIRRWMSGVYAFCDRIVQYRAWDEEFFKTLQNDFPEYKKMTFNQAFYQWQKSFSAMWPNLLTEPPSKLVEVDKIKLEAVVSLVEALLPEVDPENKARVIQWAAENFNDLKQLFTSPLEMDYDTIAEYIKPMPTAPGGGEEEGEEKEPKPKVIGDSDGEVLEDLRSIRDSMLRAVTHRADSAPPSPQAQSISVHTPPVAVSVNPVGARKVTFRRLDDGSIEGTITTEQQAVSLREDARGDLVGQVHDK